MKSIASFMEAVPSSRGTASKKNKPPKKSLAYLTDPVNDDSDDDGEQEQYKPNNTPKVFTIPTKPKSNNTQTAIDPTKLTTFDAKVAEMKRNNIAVNDANKPASVRNYTVDNSTPASNVTKVGNFKFSGVSNNIPHKLPKVPSNPEAERNYQNKLNPASAVYTRQLPNKTSAVGQRFLKQQQDRKNNELIDKQKANSRIADKKSFATMKKIVKPYVANIGKKIRSRNYWHKDIKPVLGTIAGALRR